MSPKMIYFLVMKTKIKDEFSKLAMSAYDRLYLIFLILFICL